MTGDTYEDYPEDQGEDLGAEQIVKIVSDLKEFGNKAFKSGDMDLALEKYEKGLRYLTAYSAPEEGEAGFEQAAELGRKANNLRFTLHSNMALLQNKLRSYRDALRAASNALEHSAAAVRPGGGPETGVSEAERAKALYRRATARAALKDDDEAVLDLEEALKLAPADAAIVKDLAEIKKRVADRRKKEKAAYQKFFDD